MNAPHELLEQYRSAFVRADGSALAACFAFPLHVVSAADGDASISTAEAEEWPSVLQGLLGSYRRLGVRDCVPAAVEITELMDSAAVVQVQWTLQREDRQTVYEFTAVYTLALVDGHLRIVAIAHDELARIQATMNGS